MPEYSAIGEAPEEICDAVDAHYRHSRGYFQTFWSYQCPLLQRDLGLFYRLMYASRCFQAFASGARPASVYPLSRCTSSQRPRPNAVASQPVLSLPGQRSPSSTSPRGCSLPTGIELRHVGGAAECCAGVPAHRGLTAGAVCTSCAPGARLDHNLSSAAWVQACGR